MSSPFEAAFAAAAVTCDAVMAELFHYRPMTRGHDVNGRPAPDTARAATTILAIYGEPSARLGSGPVRTVGVDADRAAHANNRPFISIRLDQLPYAPADGDHAIRDKTGVTYRVAEILPGFGVARLDLNRVG
ncbi:hypothetical protein RA307_09840 [Xanthobacteraceae bacterium Astr-EGSB]|uniref:hypothetical protein n=1 Tax=Astrobacterium formosum TaxID=3069710 RepID=UPI0027B6AD1A|nr:hypothetical protein [Xanthobacteraceae bacterium Astr-EGSB]